MSILDDLIANAGLYIGVDRGRDPASPGAARIVVTPLPGKSGVAIDYEIFNADHADSVRGHVEHTMVARLADDSVVMLVGAPHAKAAHLLRETDPGVFEEAGAPSPYPAKVVIAVPEPGRLVHSWWYNAPGEEPVERDVTEAVRQP